MALRRYSIFGVCFEADVALDLPSADEGDEPRFALSEVEGVWPPRDAGKVVQRECDDWLTFQVYDDGDIEIQWGNWLHFWVDPAGKTLLYRVVEEEYPTAFEAYVANFATSACLLLQGEELLHSTVVRHRCAGIGFLGASGAGKSTLTAYLLSKGAELVTDDMLRISERKGELYAEPGQHRLKLFKETAQAYLPQMIEAGRWNPVSEKYLFNLAPPNEAREAHALNALILLTGPVEGDEDRVKLRRLEGLELFRTLISSTMNSRLQTRDRLARQFAFAEALSEKLPVYALHYPRRHDIFPNVIEAIEGAIALR